MARKMKLDFTGVESYERAEEGLHVCKIASADLKQSQGGNDMIVVAFEVTKGNSKGARVYENYPLIDTALWKLKGMLQAIGMKADGRVQLDLDRLIGKTLQVNVIHEEYEGKIRARVESVMKLGTATSDAADDEDDEEEPEEKPAKKPAAKKKAPMNKPEPEEGEDEDDDWDEDDDDEEEEEEEKKPAPKKKPASSKKPASKKSSKKKEEPEEDEDDEDWDDDDWDEE